MSLKSLSNFHNLSVKEVLEQLKSSENGIHPIDASARLKKYGTNEILEKNNFNYLRILLRQVNSFLVYILVIAAVISYLTDHAADAVVIVAVISLNTIFGFIQEYRAEKSISALKNLIVLKAKVIRHGDLTQIDAKYLVPGDIIVLEEGDKVPADARLISTSNFMTTEASITGESLPSEKNTKVVELNVGISDQKNMIFTGTVASLGKAKAVVVGTGSNTVIGQIAKDITQTEETKSHFEIVTAKLAKQMAVVAICGSIFIFLVGYFIRGIEFSEIFLFSVASLVSAIPEGLPAVLTIVLAIGSYRMSKRKAIIRDLKATETIGIVNVIATDKTGTLTQNTMTVTDIVLADGTEYSVTGNGWKSEGEFFEKGKVVKVKGKKDLLELLQIGFLSNNSKVIEDNGKFTILGDPTEAAFVVLAEKAGLEEEVKDKVIFDLTFNSEYKYRATLVEHKNNNQIYVVGAPENVLKKCNIKDLEKYHSQIKELSSKGLRVIGLASKDFNNTSKEITHKDTDDLTFIGFVGMKDPPRTEVKEAILKAQNAGVRVIMLTGDHKETAIAIAKEVGLAKEGDKALTEDELKVLSHSDFVKAVMSVNIFSRLSPKMKLTIAQTLQKKGLLVAMTGDGVNDAPALKQADVGLSMGIIGTDTAREASEIVLADDNFASIVNAIEEGRIVFTNVRRSSSFLVTTNVAEQLTILLTIVLGYPLPLLTSQILWLNLVTDGVNDFALATERSHGMALNSSPRKRNEGILNKDTLIFVIVMSIVMMALTLFFFIMNLDKGEPYARTIAFLFMSFTQLFNALNLRSFTQSIFKIGLFSNRVVVAGFIASALLNLLAIYAVPLRDFLKFTYVEPSTMLSIFVLSSIALWIGEIVKLLRRQT